MEEGWERPPRIDLSPEQVRHLVEPAFPGKEIAELSTLATGLANTNVRFRVHGDARAYVLRLHTRDPDAARRESELMSFLAKGPVPRVPAAPLIFSDLAPERGDWPYSIWGFVDGTLLQELFGTLGPAEFVEIARACGRVLASISARPFPECGELGPGLTVVREYGNPSRFVPEVVHRALFEGRAGGRLGAGLRDALWRVVERWSPRLEAIDGPYALVHGDYKRSNLLMVRTDAGWRVGAVLDWEFAFAGPPLVDVGLFLRAGGALPEGFRQAFASGYLEAGGTLPEDWLPLSRLVDVVSQMIFLDDPRERPRVFAETAGVVKETVRMLSS
jgi:aminoglycoside phosphotransferase (APT) family kinase protein